MEFVENQSFLSCKTVNLYIFSIQDGIMCRPDVKHQEKSQTKVKASKIRYHFMSKRSDLCLVFLSSPFLRGATIEFVNRI